MLFSSVKGQRRTGALQLVLVLALTVAACTADAPTAVAPDDARKPSLQVLEDWPDDLYFGCGFSPSSGDNFCRFHATFDTPMYVDSLSYNHWYLTSDLIHSASYYNARGGIDLNSPLPIAPMTISFSPAVNALRVDAEPTVSRCYYSGCKNYRDAEGREPHGSWVIVAYEADGKETRVSETWECAYSAYNCGSTILLGSDVGLVKIEIIPSGSTLRDHLGFMFIAGRYRQSDSLTLACPDSVTRGTTATCTVKSSSSDAELEVLEWHFQPADTSLGSDIARPDVTAQDTTWEGMMAASGTVLVRAKLADSVQEATRFITVMPRPGWDTTKVTFPKPPVSDDGDMDDKPYRDPGDESLGQLGHIHEQDATYDIGGKVEVIGSGPNAGLAFLTAIPYIPRWEIHINFDQLRPNSNLGMRQIVNSPAYESEPACTRSKLPGFEALIKKHEGADLEEKSHAGRYATTFNKKAGSVAERLVLTETDFAEKRELDRVAAAFKPVVADAVAESDKADKDFKVQFGCRIDFFPTPTTK